MTFKKHNKIHTTKRRETDTAARTPGKYHRRWIRRSAVAVVVKDGSNSNRGPNQGKGKVLLTWLQNSKEELESNPFKQMGALKTRHCEERKGRELVEEKGQFQQCEFQACVGAFYRKCGMLQQPTPSKNMLENTGNPKSGCTARALNMQTTPRSNVAP